MTRPTNRVDKRLVAISQGSALVARVHLFEPLAIMDIRARSISFGQQFMRVEHVHVNDGGQAVVGNVKKPDVQRGRSLLARSLSGLIE
jgi:hypothetical protein